MGGACLEVVQAESRWIPQPRASGWVAVDLVAVLRWTVLRDQEDSVEAAIEGVGMGELWEHRLREVGVA